MQAVRLWFVAVQRECGVQPLQRLGRRVTADARGAQQRATQVLAMLLDVWADDVVVGCDWRGPWVQVVYPFDGETWQCVASADGLVFHERRVV